MKEPISGSEDTLKTAFDHTALRRLLIVTGFVVVSTVSCLIASCYASTSVLRIVAIVVSLCGPALAGTIIWRRMRSKLEPRDRLCGVPDRAHFRQRLDDATKNNGGSSTPFSVLYVDLEGVREINEAHGLEAGDRLIAMAATRLLSTLSAGDVLARIGGDEFAIIQRRAKDRIATAQFAQRILDMMQLTFNLQGRTVLANASIGIVISSSVASNADAVMRGADAALQWAKQAGKGRFEIFDPGQDLIKQERRAFSHALHKAIEHDELTVHYQPVVSAKTLQMVGVEALLRWNHPTRHLLAPRDFIPLAEECGLLPAFGAWILRRACMEGQRWPGLNVAVNVSPAQFRHKDFVSTIVAILADTGFDPHRLEIELTESVVIDDAEQAEESIIQLRALGIRMAIDDFGTGYSSLIYLRRFAFDKMKIDKSFVQLLEAQGESAVIVDSIVKLGRALSLTVTAEGVETRQQQDYLRSLGCDELQGYLYSQPVAGDRIDTLLTTQVWTGTAPNADMVRSVA